MEKNSGLCLAPDCLSAYYHGCGTRFHLFPENVRMRKKWLKSLNLTPKDLYSGARICYLHFNPSHYKCNNPKNPLKANAVPTTTAKQKWPYEDHHSNTESIDLDNLLGNLSGEEAKKNSDTQKKERQTTSKTKAGKIINVKKEDNKKTILKVEMVCDKETGVGEIMEVENVLTHVCRTCLAIGCKMYSMKQYNLEQTYLLLYGDTLIVFDETKMPQMVCYECHRRLRNFMEFREKTFRAWSCLKQLIEQDRLTMADVKSIDRRDTLLASNLVYTLSVPNYYDMHLEYEAENQCYVKASNSNRTGEIDIDLNQAGEIEIDLNQAGEIEIDLNQAGEIDTDLNRAGEIDIQRDRQKNDVEVEKIKESDDESDKWDFENEDNSKTEQDSRVDKEYCVKTEKGSIKTLQDLFIVKTMTPEEQREEVVNRKNSRSYINAKYRCEKCFRGYRLEKPFNSHMKRHTNESGELVCDICQFHFHKRLQLLLHISKSHSRYISCKKCTFGTTLEISALCHKNYHDGFRFQCTLCPKHYSKQSTYVNHVRRVHPEDIICHLCGVSLAVIRELDRHLRIVHKAENLYLQPPTESSKFGPVQRKQVSEYAAVSYASTLPVSAAFCVTCDIRFLTEEALQQHLSQAPSHGHPSIYQPPKSSQKKKYCEEIKKTNKPRTPVSYTCEQCGETFPASRAYSHHFRTEHPGLTSALLRDRARFVCEICGKSYGTAYLLNDHRGVHLGRRPHSCAECHKSYFTKASLRAHQADHRQPLACPVCGKVLSSVANRFKHMRIHTRKPYECGTCNKRFVTPSDKRNHIKHAHMGVPYPKKRPKGAPTLQRSDFDDDQVKSEAGTSL